MGFISVIWVALNSVSSHKSYAGNSVKRDNALSALSAHPPHTRPHPQPWLPSPSSLLCKSKGLVEGPRPAGAGRTLLHSWLSYVFMEKCLITILFSLSMRNEFPLWERSSAALSSSRCWSGRHQFYSKGSGSSTHCRRRLSELKSVLSLGKAGTPSLLYRHHSSTPGCNSFSALSEQLLSKIKTKQMTKAKRGIPGREHILKTCQRLHEVCPPFMLNFTWKTLSCDSGGGQQEAGRQWYIQAALQETVM